MDASFKINGEEFPIPDLASLTLDESIVFYEYAQMTVSEVGQLEGDVPPGVVAALLHTAIARAQPAKSKKQLRKEIGEINMIDLLAAFDDGTPEDDALPPASELDASASSVEPNSLSGAHLNDAGASFPDDNSEAASTGSPGSDTTAVSVPAIWAG